MKDISALIPIFENILQGFEKIQEVSPQIKNDVEAAIKPFKDAYHLLIALFKHEVESNRPVFIYHSFLMRAQKIIEDAQKKEISKETKE